ncbi:hypothetical protein FH972_026191 [Carpinus fangiana]|uniref:Xylanolytic transcriptional activator regulatory domain-containing protein n=1 Tax=Carpinus fangiana TaxID=176857 RepID=A0A5N6L3S0_9ROSI|nr:hypothetical protein FH972_026191 [Carpinus fangiana]
MDFAFPNLAIPDVHFIHGAEPGVFFGGEYGALPSFANGSALSTGLTPGGMPWDERMFAMNTPSVQSTGLGAVTDDVAMQVDGAQIHRPQRTLSNSAAPPPQPHPPAIQPSDDIRYPVLKPIIPYLKNIIPLPLAFDLLEHYFSTSSTSYPHPRSPYIITFIFGKRAFLRPQRPRSCSMALLASMLWIAARTSDAKYLSASPSSRGRVCQKLLELTVKLLRPLVHRPPQQLNAAAGLSAGDVAGAAMADVEEPVDHEGVERSANGTLDDVATYIHLGVVVSASEYKGASLRWWNAAWGLARELKLGRELAPNSSASVRGLRPDLGDDGQSIAQPVTEEEREERRRIWWLLFSMDRHLSLCYNKPICLPDRECETLLQPMDERSWQNNDFDFVLAPDAAQHQQHQAHGPPVVFNGPSLFGYFLPLMAILGEIIDLNHARSHPRFGSAFINAGLWDEQARIINLRLENFEESVRTYEAQHLSDLGVISANVSSSDPSQATSRTSFSSATTDAQQQQQQQQQQQLAFEAHMQQKKALVYATHIMHVLHILLTGRWDPIALLDDADLWIYSQSFVTATGHAVAAAEACGAILTHDPDISFMPFLYGIYLLQGSFLLLLMADKLGRGAAPDVIRACETVVRAHEACAVTLNTEYQRNFRKVMRSALGQVRGQCGGEADAGVEEARRREVLSLYRWTGDGTGLNTE